MKSILTAHSMLKKIILVIVLCVFFLSSTMCADIFEYKFAPHCAKNRFELETMPSGLRAVREAERHTSFFSGTLIIDFEPRREYLGDWPINIIPPGYRLVSALQNNSIPTGGALELLRENNTLFFATLQELINQRVNWVTSIAENRADRDYKLDAVLAKDFVLGFLDRPENKYGISGVSRKTLEQSFSAHLSEIIGGIEGQMQRMDDEERKGFIGRYFYIAFFVSGGDYLHNPFRPLRTEKIRSRLLAEKIRGAIGDGEAQRAIESYQAFLDESESAILAEWVDELVVAGKKVPKTAHNELDEKFYFHGTQWNLPNIFSTVHGLLSPQEVERLIEEEAIQHAEYSRWDRTPHDSIMLGERLVQGVGFSTSVRGGKRGALFLLDRHNPAIASKVHDEVPKEKLQDLSSGPFGAKTFFGTAIPAKDRAGEKYINSSVPFVNVAHIFVTEESLIDAENALREAGLLHEKLFGPDKKTFYDYVKVVFWSNKKKSYALGSGFEEREGGLLATASQNLDTDNLQLAMWRGVQYALVGRWNSVQSPIQKEYKNSGLSRSQFILKKYVKSNLMPPPNVITSSRTGKALREESKKLTDEVFAQLTADDHEFAEYPSGWRIVEPTVMINSRIVGLEKKKGGPVPLPPLNGIAEEDIKPAWDIVSARYPRLAAAVQRIESYDRMSPLDPNARYNYQTRTLRLPRGEKISISTLHHEFTHVAQGVRNRLKPRTEMSEEEFLTAEGAARARANRAKSQSGQIEQHRAGNNLLLQSI